MDCFGTYFTHAQSCDNLRVPSATEWTASVHNGTYFTHAQSCDNVHVQSATEWTASVHTLHMPKAVITFVFQVLRNGLLRYIMVHTLHMPKAVITFVFQVLRNGLLRYILYTCPKPLAQKCDNVRVPSATEWTASVHTLHMPKAVITFVFQVLRNGLLRYILYTCPKL